MYVTRRLSMYKKDPSALSLPPPDGPNTGILVVQDVENEFTNCSSCTQWLSYDITSGLPFSQNANLMGKLDGPGCIPMMVFPVINKPLSSRLYYVVDMKSHPGFPVTCPKVKGQYRCCLCLKCNDYAEVDPIPLEPSNLYQQFYITGRGSAGGFKFNCLASDGLVLYPYTYLHSLFYAKQPIYIDVDDDDAFGLDRSLRERLPEFNFPLSRESSDAVVVGRWYCPFLFVKESHSSAQLQMKTSMFYKMTLKQKWVRVFSCDAPGTESTIGGGEGGDDPSVINVDVNVKTQVVDVVGMKTLDGTAVSDGGTKWFHGLDEEGEAIYMGLHNAIIEKINQDQQSFGWIREKDKVERVEKFQGKSGDPFWKKFGCYILVEKYILRAMNRRLVFTNEFRHTHQIRCKWEC